MPHAEQVQYPAEEVRGGLGIEESQRLLALGFDPVAPVYHSTSGFDPDRIRDTLFEGDFRDPVLLPFEWHDGLKGSTPVILPMEVEIVQRVFVTFIASQGERKGERVNNKQPEWYLRGLLAKSQLNPHGEVIRMHAYIHWMQLDGDDFDNSARIQILRELPTRTPPVSYDGWIAIGESYPTLP
jgi:hypothetical protein